jgi:Holliday junction DNA helicase RuvA
MIARLEGQLVKLDTDSALVQVGAVGYEVMLAGYCVDALSDKIGSDITLCTMEYYEGAPGGGNLIPRMVGFLNANERNFFTKFISVKGMGIKKGLRSLTIPISTIAAAIENGDDKTLISLPAEAGLKPYQVEALEILIAWGEKRTDAMELIELACHKNPDINSAEELVPLVYRLKQGVEV